VSDFLSPGIPGRASGPGTPEQHPLRVHREPQRVPENRLAPDLAGKGFDLHRDQKAVGPKTQSRLGPEKRKSNCDLLWLGFLHLLLIKC
jgi:hypothetical protein